jgi:hypothetical protein
MKVFLIIAFLFAINISFGQEIKEKIIDTVKLYVKITKVEQGRDATIYGIAKYKNKQLIVYNGGFDGLWSTYSICAGLTIYREVYIIKQTYKGKTEVFGRASYTDFLETAE